MRTCVRAVDQSEGWNSRDRDRRSSDQAGRLRAAPDRGARPLRPGLRDRRPDLPGAVQVGSSWLTPAGYVRTPYTPEEIDLVAVYCGDLDRCYLLPSRLACGRTTIFLRVSPPKNGQRACINLASDFELPGAVAQLEEHRHGMARVRGSSPLSSTSSPDPTEIIRTGSNEFRNHFGHYMERAAAGDEIHISRHGRPFARLMPPQDQLLAAA